jgi:phenylpropionate dioxygenase-like ring-hydroxylating dioxygenase large terminal subunit
MLPATGGGGMYINFWYPIALAREITADKPIRVRLLGVDLVAWRDSAGAAHVQADTCVHRGGSLSRGTIKDDCIVCPYHGWRFGGDGKCRTVPSLGPDGKIPARAKIDSYPVQEQYGIVFAFLGDLPETERPPLYQIPEFNTEGWRDSDVVILDLGAYFERSMENGLDPAHNEFVHPSQGAPGLEPDYLKNGLALEDSAWGTRFLVSFDEKSQDPSELANLRASRRGVRAGSGHVGPNQLQTWIKFSATNAFHQYFFEAPVDEARTRIFFINTRNCMLDPAKDAVAMKANMQVANEDIAVLTELNPVRTPENNVKEILLPTDQAVVRYRQYLNQWEERGWRIDLKRLRETRGDIAYAIPSPGRRLSGNWVLDTIPLLPGRQSAVNAAPEMRLAR